MDIDLEAKRQALLAQAKSEARDQLKPLALLLGSSVAADAVANAVFAFVNVMTGGQVEPPHVDQPLEFANAVSGTDHIPDEHLTAATTMVAAAPPEAADGGAALVQTHPIEAVSEPELPLEGDPTEAPPVETVPETPPIDTSIHDATPHGDALDPSDVDGCGFCGAVPPTPYHAVNCSRPSAT